MCEMSIEYVKLVYLPIWTSSFLGNFSNNTSKCSTNIATKSIHRCYYYWSIFLRIMLVPNDLFAIQHSLPHILYLQYLKSRDTSFTTWQLRSALGATDIQNLGSFQEKMKKSRHQLALWAIFLSDQCWHISAYN